VKGHADGTRGKLAACQQSKQTSEKQEPAGAGDTPTAYSCNPIIMLWSNCVTYSNQIFSKYVLWIWNQTRFIRLCKTRTNFAVWVRLPIFIFVNMRVIRVRKRYAIKAYKEVAVHTCLTGELQDPPRNRSEITWKQRPVRVGGEELILLLRDSNLDRPARSQSFY
jgi:hypothetical protein